MTDLVQKLVGALTVARDTLPHIGGNPSSVHSLVSRIDAALSEAKAGGWVAVPVEPTPEMIAAALRECGGIGGGSCGEHTGIDGSDLAWVWGTMLAARPLPAPPAQRGGESK